MKRIILSALLSFIIYGAFSQSKLAIGGSFSIAAICKDGIIIGDDSRGSFFKTEDSILAYFDGVQKVFIVKKCALSIIGLIVIGDRFVSSYLYEYEKTISDNITSENLLTGFSFFFQTKYPQYMSDFMKLHFISVCYKDGRSMLCTMNGTAGKCGFDKGVGVADTTEFVLNGKYNLEYCIKHTCEEVKPLIEKAIRGFAKTHHKEHAIGGKIMFIKLTPDSKIIWDGGEPKKTNWETTDDFFKEYKQGRIKITFTSDDAKKVIYDHYQL